MKEETINILDMGCAYGFVTKDRFQKIEEIKDKVEDKFDAIEDKFELQKDDD